MNFDPLTLMFATAGAIGEQLITSNTPSSGEGYCSYGDSPTGTSGFFNHNHGMSDQNMYQDFSHLDHEDALKQEPAPDSTYGSTPIKNEPPNDGYSVCPPSAEPPHTPTPGIGSTTGHPEKMTPLSAPPTPGSAYNQPPPPYMMSHHNTGLLTTMPYSQCMQLPIQSAPSRLPYATSPYGSAASPYQILPADSSSMLYGSHGDLLPPGHYDEKGLSVPVYEGCFPSDYSCQPPPMSVIPQYAQHRFIETKGRVISLVLGGFFIAGFDWLIGFLLDFK